MTEPVSTVAEPPGRPGRLRETLTYLWWFYTPFRTMSAADIYDLVGTRALGEDGFYLNYGYWEGADSFADASRALVELVSDTAEMGPGQQVLDLGFGHGQQDFHWLERHDPARIVGLNITPTQVAFARRRAEELGVTDRIDFRQGDAVDLPFEDESFDKVVAVESAFHFRTRDRFMAEAFRVLKPGGRLVAADVAAMPKPSGWKRLSYWYSWQVFRTQYDVPTENVYGTEVYAERLRDAGFSGVRVDSIRDQVWAPMHDFVGRHPKMLSRLHLLARLPYKMALKFPASVAYAAYDYVLAVGDKPV